MVLVSVAPPRYAVAHDASVSFSTVRHRPGARSARIAVRGLQPSVAGVAVLSVHWSVKGGAGTTVVTASVALALARGSHHSVVLVDLAGDLPAVLGLPEPDGPGVAEWSRHPRGGAALGATAVAVGERLALVPRGNGPFGPLPAPALAAVGAHVVVDAGTIAAATTPPAQLAAHADHSVLVTRACYLSLRRAVTVGVRPSEIVVVLEPGRALGARDIAAVVGAPVTAEVPWDSAVARTVDAGLLASRLPPVLVRTIGRRP